MFKKRLPFYAQQLLVDRPGFFIDIFLGVSLAMKYQKQLEIKEITVQKKISSSSDDEDSSSDSSSSSSDEDKNPILSLQRKRSKTDSFTGQLPLIHEDKGNNTKETSFDNTKEKENLVEKVKEEEKKEKEPKIEQEYLPKRSKTTYQRGGLENLCKNENTNNGLIEKIIINKTIDYQYMEYLLKILDDDINEVVLGYLQKILSGFLSRKPMEVRFIL